MNVLGAKAASRIKKPVRGLAVVWWLLFSSGIVVIPWHVLQSFSVLPGKYALTMVS
jgi:hypothetical protein